MKGLRALFPILLIAFTPCVSLSADSLQDLLSGLDSWDKDRQIQSAVGLGEMGPAAQMAVPALIRMVKTGRPEVRVVSSIALLKIDPDMKDMVPILLQALNKQGGELQAPLPKEVGLQDDALQKWSALMRSKLDPGILPILVEATKSSDADIRVLGVLVLGGISKQIPEALPYVLSAYEDPDNAVRGAVIGVLSRIGPSAPEVVPGILRGLKDKELDVRLQSIQALGSMDPSPKQAVPELALLAERGSPEEQIAASEVLFKLDPSQSDRIAPRLLRLLRDSSQESSIRLRAAGLMAQVNLAAGGGNALTGLLEDPDPAVRGKAVQLLSGFGLPAVPALLDSLKSPRSLRRAGALQALIQTRPIPPELVPALTDCLKDRDRSIRYLAVKGLGELGALAQAAVPKLVEMLKDSDESIRVSAGDALLNMGPAAVSALDQAASQQENPQLRARAEMLLKKARR